MTEYRDSSTTEVEHPQQPTHTPGNYATQLPIAKRVNRNVLIIFATVAGIIVIVALLFLTPRTPSKREQELANAAAAPVVPPTTYLDQSPPGTRDYSAGGTYDPNYSNPAPPPASSPAYSPPPNGIPAAGESSAGYNADPYTMGSTPAPSVSPREQAYIAALKSRPMAAESPGGASATAGNQLVNGPGPNSTSSASMGEGDLSAALAGLPGPYAPMGQSSQRPVGRAGYNAFLASARAAQPTRIATSVEPAVSPFMLQAGTIIPGLLITGINSDLPGDIQGQVSRDVYDSRTQRVLLLPKGSRLIGSYDNEVAVGQNRLLVAWTRVIFPDGRSISLPGLGIKDPQGVSGVRDQVNNHYFRVFGTAVLLSAISAGAQLSQPRQPNNIYAVPTAGQVAAGAVGDELARVAAQILQRNLDIQPTISIRQGQPFAVFLNADLTFPGRYVDQRR